MYPTSGRIYPLAPGKYCNISLITIPTVELYRSEVKTLPTLITEEEEGRRLAGAAISAATAFRGRRQHRPTSHIAH